MTLEDRALNLAQVWVRLSDGPAARHDFLVHLGEAYNDGVEAAAARARNLVKTQRGIGWDTLAAELRALKTSPPRSAAPPPPDTRQDHGVEIREAGW